MANWYLYRKNFVRGASKGARNISDTLENNGIKFLLGMAKWGIYRPLIPNGELHPDLLPLLLDHEDLSPWAGVLTICGEDEVPGCLLLGTFC